MFGRDLLGFTHDGECLEDRARLQIEMVGRQTVQGAKALSGMSGL